jgi:hypothetical protein
MAFETVFDASNGTIFKFEKPGDTLEGYYMGSFDYEGDYGPTKKHAFSTEAGAVVVFGQRNLLQLLPSVKPGVMIRVTYTEDLPPKKKGQQPMKLFKVEQDKKNTIEVGEVQHERAAAADTDADLDDADLAADDSLDDVVIPNRATRPAQAAAPQAAKTAALLGGRRNKTA